MPRNKLSDKNRLRELAPAQLITATRLRDFSFPSLPPIGTALIANNHPYEVIDYSEIEYPEGVKHPAIVWQSRCQYCDQIYQDTKGLAATPSRNCPKHRANGEDPGGRQARMQEARERILNAVKDGKALLSRLNTSQYPLALLKIAANELEEEGLIQRSGKGWTFQST